MEYYRMGWIERLKGKKMKRMIWLILIALTVVVFLVGCRKNAEHDTDNIDGGVRIDTSYDAPKEIQSTEITFFYCEFSNLTMMNKDTFLKNRVYQLKAVLKDDKVQGSYQTYVSGEKWEESFEVETEFMNAVQKIIKNHNLVQHNGHSYLVSGLPDQFGAKLEVEYESGERIYASDNQNNFLSIAAMEEMDKLFRKQFEAADEIIEDGGFPKVLDVTVSKQFFMENINGRYITLESPVIELGYEAPDGQWLNTDGYPALEEALSTYNKEEWEFHVGSRSTLRSAAESIVSNDETLQELYTYTDAYVTRNDTKVLSFYTFTRHFEGWVREFYDWEVRNFHVESGKILNFEDVFTDLGQLTYIVAAELKAAYPDLHFQNNMDKLITAGMKENKGLLFALSYDGVHIFAENQYLSNEDTKGQHIVLAYSDYPEILKEVYRVTTKNWMLKLDYGVTYPLTPTMYFEMNWKNAGDDTEEVLWNTRVNGMENTERFYGYAPECYLICMEDRYYLYLRVPAGDVTLLTYIYEVRENGVMFRGEVNGAMHEEVNFNPECIKMYKSKDFDELEFGETLPFDIFAVGEEGYPMKLGETEY